MPSRWEQKEDIKKMQQDAIKRVQEMQSKAKEKISQTTTMTVNKNSQDLLDESRDEFIEKPKISLNNLYDPDNFLKAITQDSERNLILMLILLLMGEKNNSDLLISLLFLII